MEVQQPPRKSEADLRIEELQMYEQALAEARALTAKRAAEEEAKAAPAPLRTEEQINADYRNICANLGDRSMKILGFQAEIESFKAQINQLGLELQALKASKEGK